MSGSFVSNLLSAGYLQAAGSVLFAVPATNVCYVSGLWLQNDSETVQDIQLWLKTDGVERFWRPLRLGGSEGANVMENEAPLLLSDLDQIIGYPTTDNVVSFHVGGVLET
jgi:hypothetical protein